MRWKMEILQQFANLKLNFLVLTKELYVNFEVSKLIRMYPYQTGRSVLLGDIHSMVQKYIKQLNNRRSVINKAAANATAHGLLTAILTLLVKSMYALLSGLRAYFQEWISKSVTYTIFPYTESRPNAIMFLLVMRRWLCVVQKVLQLRAVLITGTFAITMHSEFLPMHIIYTGKTVKSVRKIEFP